MASTGDTWRLGRRPALDGLRGVAVLLVVLFHTNLAMPLHGAGAAGVAIFFVLSGFLITAQLLERRDRGGLDLRRFAARRARRLVPGLLVFLGAMIPVALYLPWLMNIQCVPLAATYTVNMATGVQCGALSQTWSLAVEVHFYVAWGIVATITLRRFGRRGVMLVALAGLVASLAVRAWLSGDIARAYAGSDTNAYALLAGSVLAVVAGRGPRLSRWAWCAGFAVVATACLPRLSLTAPVAAAAGAAFMISQVSVDSAPRWLSARWLTLVGQRSYGLYLWHLPIVYFAYALTQQGLPFVPTMLAAVALSWVVALASWRYVEQPFAASQRDHVGPDGEVRASVTHGVEPCVSDPAAARVVVSVAPRGAI